MKYMLMMFGDQQSMLEVRSTEWVREMVRFMHKFNDDLTASGEFVLAEGLADAALSKTVRIREGIAVATDGPFAEAKESLAGFWIVDVEDEARAIELSQQVVSFTKGPIEIRQVMDGPPPEFLA